MKVKGIRVYMVEKSLNRINFSGITSRSTLGYIDSTVKCAEKVLMKKRPILNTRQHNTGQQNRSVIQSFQALC